MSTTPSQRAIVHNISDTEVNTNVPTLPVLEKIQGPTTTVNMPQNETQFVIFSDTWFSDFDIRHPNTWFSFVFMVLGIYLAITLSWQCSFDYSTVYRVLFAATASLFNWVYVLFHFLVQSTACQALLKK